MRNKEKYTNILRGSNNRIQLVTETFSTFCNDLYRELTDETDFQSDSKLTYNMFYPLATRLQKSEDYLDSEEIQKLNFSRRWWQKYKHNRNIN